jgi:hypothetical protein
MDIKIDEPLKRQLEELRALQMAHCAHTGATWCNCPDEAYIVNAARTNIAQQTVVLRELLKYAGQASEPAEPTIRAAKAHNDP